MRAFIEDLEYYLPERVVTNEELQRDHPSWDMDLVVERSGVEKRHFASPDETAYDLALEACKRLFTRHDLNLVDGIIFCTQTPDYLMPSNAFLLHRDLEMREDVLAFDYNLACSGFIYGLAIIQGFVSSGLAKRVLLVTADTYSKLTNEGDRSARVLFGDGAAATLVASSDSTRGIIDLALATAGRQFDRFWVPAGGFRLPRSQETALETTDPSGNQRSLNDIHMDGMGVWSFINSSVPKHVRALLDRNQTTLDDVDLFIFHQASKMTIDSLTKSLSIPRSKVFTNLAEVGNTVSASIPIAIKEAWAGGHVSTGDKILLSGFGVGLSAGTLLMEA